MKLPVVSGREAIRRLQRAGFVATRQRGSHVRLEKRTADSSVKLTVPLHPELKPGTLVHILAGVKRLAVAGFDRVVIATDHGFVLQDERPEGDTVPKPSGDWRMVKDRCLLGRGSGSDLTAVFDKAEAGIRGDFDLYVVPRNFGTFVKGGPYYHEGLSLQECVLPVLSLDLRKGRSETAPKPEITLGYRGGTADKVTTRRPVVEVSLFKKGRRGNGRICSSSTTGMPAPLLPWCSP